MTTETVRTMLGWCSVINIGLLLWWFFAFTVLHDWVYKIHGKWFKMSVETFDAAHYLSMGFFKIVVLVFNIVPYFVLYIIK